MQKSNKRTEMKNINNVSQKKIGYYIPIIFIIIVVPLITYGKIVELPIEEADFWKGGTTHVDFFNYYKFIAIIISTFAATVAYGGLFLNNKLPLQREKRYYIPMSIYASVAIMSSIMSQSKHVALVGFIEMYQGIFVLLSYITLTFILINYIRNERDVKVIVYSFAVLVIIEGLLGLSQYFGFDFLQSLIGQWLIIPEVLSGTELKFAFGEHTIYGTMYNSNYVGSFGALVLPITIGLYLLSADKRKSILFGSIALLAFTTWLGCNSRAGYLGIMVSLIIGIIIFRKVIIKKYRKTLVLLSGFIIITILFNIVSGGRAFNQFLRLNPMREVEKIEEVQEQQEVVFEEISVNKNTFKVITNKETLFGVMEESNLSFKDEMGNLLGVKIDKKGNIKFVDDKYEGYSFIISSDQPSQIKSNIYGKSLNFYITAEQNIKVISLNGKLTEPIEAPYIKLFDGRETFASNRGYVWSRTIPMLKNTIIIGYGPDNYPMVFPQEDYVGRFNVGNNGMINTVIDKPHNMYLQMAINTGVLSLISLFTIWAIYFIDSFKIYINGNMTTFIEYVGAAIFLSIIAYLVAGLFNDSVVSVAPLFWILLGTGIGTNGIVKQSSNI